jgi:hypothetical protein
MYTFVKIKTGSPIEKKILLDARTKASHTNDHKKTPYHLPESKWVHRH